MLNENLPDKALTLLEKATLLENINFSPQEMFIHIQMNFPSIKDGIARAYTQKGDVDKAIAEYEQLIHFGTGEKEQFLSHPINHYRLAKLYEKTSQNSKAMEHYDKFLDPWKNADLWIAEVEEVRERVAGLKQ